jgi:hypothetical protein
LEADWADQVGGSLVPARQLCDGNVKRLGLIVLFCWLLGSWAGGLIDLLAVGFCGWLVGLVGVHDGFLSSQLIMKGRPNR